MKPAKIMGLFLGAILVATLLPYIVINLSALGDSQISVNGTIVTWASAVDSTITTLFTVILPIVIAITVFSWFMYKRSQ